MPDRVLIRDSLTPAQVDPVGCAVIAGDWYSTYDNITTSDPTDTTIDHVVALAEAWDPGAHSWTNERRVDFANDLADRRSLRVVTAGVNSSKGAADPSNWIPPHSPAVCGYLADWVSIKARWSLTMDQSEHGRIRNLFTDRCPNQTIAAWPITPAPQPPDPDAPPSVCDPSYPTVCIPPPPPDLDCGDIVHRNFTVIGADPHRFDGNNDGIGCQS